MGLSLLPNKSLDYPRCCCQDVLGTVVPPLSEFPNVTSYRRRAASILLKEEILFAISPLWVRLSPQHT
jgi:hypothetical protein